MEAFLVLFLFVGALFAAFLFFTIAALISKSGKTMPSRKAHFRQGRTSAHMPFLNTGIYPGLYPGQIPPPDMGITSSSIPDASSGFSGSDAGAMVSTPDLGSVITAGDMGVVSGGDIGGTFGGDAGSGISSS